MAQLNVISVSEAKKAIAHGARPPRRPHPQRLRRRQRRVLLRLPPRVPPAGPGARPHRGGARAASSRPAGSPIETTLDPRMQRAADGSVADPRPPDRPGHRRARDGRAGHRRGHARWRSRARWAPTRPRARPTSTTSSRRSTATPTGSRPARRSRCSCSPPRSSRASRCRRRSASPQTVDITPSELKTCDGTLASVDTWSPSNSTGAGTFDLYTGTQHSVNTFFAQLEARTGLCDPVTLARDMGVDVPEQDVVGPFTLGVTNTDPLTMAGAYATFAARGEYCEPRPVERILSSTGKVIAEYPDKCQQLMPSAVADAVNDVLARRAGARRLRLRQRPRPRPAVRRQDRHHRRQQGGVVRRLHAEPRHRGDARRRQLPRPPDHPQRPVRRRRSTSTGRSAPPRPARSGGTPCRRSRTSCPTSTSPIPTRRRSPAARSTVPSVGGLEPADAADPAPRGRVRAEHRVLRRLDLRRGHVAYTDPVAGATLGTGSPVTIYISNGNGTERRRLTATAATLNGRAGTAVAGSSRHSVPGRPSVPAAGAELAPYLRGDHAAVGAAAHLRLHARPSPCPSPACPRRPRRSRRSPR